MAVSLTKGGNVNLSKEVEKTGGTLSGVIVGLGWNPRQTDGAPFDLDASAFRLKGDAVGSDDDFVFYGHLKTADGAIEHTGDNLTGEGEGDDEQIKINLSAIPAEYDKIPVVVNIYEAASRGQNFGMVSDAFIRVVNAGDNAEIARYDLSEDASTDAAMIFGELYRKDGEWKFRAVGQGSAEGLSGLAKNYGVHV